MRRERALRVVLFAVGLIFSALSLSFEDVCAARACVGNDAEPLCHARHFPAAGCP